MPELDGFGWRGRKHGRVYYRRWRSTQIKGRSSNSVICNILILVFGSWWEEFVSACAWWDVR